MTSFHSLSYILTGFSDIDTAEAAEMGKAFAVHPALSQLLTTWEQRPENVVPEEWVQQSLWSGPLLAPCQDLILSWYFGAIYVNGKVVLIEESAEITAARRFRGRFWSIVGAHPPGLSGGYFGYWSYPAEV